MNKNRQRFESAFSYGRETRLRIKKVCSSLPASEQKDWAEAGLKLWQKGINPKFRPVFYAGFKSKGLSGKVRKAIIRKRLALS